MNSSEYMHIDFHNRAKKIFFTVYRDFLNATAFINRNESELQYQQFYRQYIYIMKRQLETAAKEVLMENQEQKRISEIDVQLNAWISDYIHQFRQKVSND